MSSTNSKTKSSYDYEMLAIGAGTAGSGVVRYAARYGKQVGVVELKKGYGGTCVQVGCVPKKLMWLVTSALEMTEGLLGPNALASIQEVRAEGKVGEMKGGFGWRRIKELRDAEVARQQEIVKTNFAKEGINRIQAHAQLVTPHSVLLTPTLDSGLPDPAQKPYTVTAAHIAITCGTTPIVPSEDDVPGVKLGITSDGFFELEERPKKVLVVGAGYIATELSGVLNALGTETHLAIRGEMVLKSFDPLIQETITNELVNKGVLVHKHTHLKSIERCYSAPSRLIATVVDANSTESTYEVDQVLLAIGRAPMTADLGLEKVGVKMDERGFVKADEWENTSVEGVYAVGDVTGKRLLTPVALAAGRRLSGRLFGPPAFKDLKLSYDFVPSVVFAHPAVGTVGLTEPEAHNKYGQDNIKIYQTKFGALPYKMMEAPSAEQPTAYKVVCVGKEEKVVGLHIVGNGSDEMLQGFAVAIKMGATMRDFLDTVAIHPTSAEEITTITPPF